VREKIREERDFGISAAKNLPHGEITRGSVVSRPRAERESAFAISADFLSQRPPLLPSPPTPELSKQITEETTKFRNASAGGERCWMVGEYGWGQLGRFHRRRK